MLCGGLWSRQRFWMDREMVADGRRRRNRARKTAVKRRSAAEVFSEGDCKNAGLPVGCDILSSMLVVIEISLPRDFHRVGGEPECLSTFQRAARLGQERAST